MVMVANVFHVQNDTFHYVYHTFYSNRLSFMIIMGIINTIVKIIFLYDKSSLTVKCGNGC